MKLRFALCLLVTFASLKVWTAEPKKIVLIAGTASHGTGQHEFTAGCLLLKKCLDPVPGVNAVVNLNGWPKDETIFDGAAAVFIYSDGGGGHPAVQGDRLKKLSKLMDQGVGFACAHYAVEVPKERGGAEFLKWMGGYFETHWSVNPTWTAEFKSFPQHPIARGVQPFSIRDEWYFHMRFVESMKSVTPILTAIAPTSTMSRSDGPHSGNPAVRKEVEAREPQHLAWTYERADGGRGFGFTGGHYHNNWGDDNFRKLVLNAILWVAKVEVPVNGVQSVVTGAELKQHLDKEGAQRGASQPVPPATQPFVSPVTGK